MVRSDERRPMLRIGRRSADTVVHVQPTKEVNGANCGRRKVVSLDGPRTATSVATKLRDVARDPRDPTMHHERGGDSCVEKC